MSLVLRSQGLRRFLIHLFKSRKSLQPWLKLCVVVLQRFRVKWQHQHADFFSLAEVEFYSVMKHELKSAKSQENKLLMDKQYMPKMMPVHLPNKIKKYIYIKKSQVFCLKFDVEIFCSGQSEHIPSHEQEGNIICYVINNYM